MKVKRRQENERSRETGIKREDEKRNMIKTEGKEEHLKTREGMGQKN